MELVSTNNLQNNELMTANTKVQESKAVAQIQACMLMAKQARRNENQAYMDIIEACKRVSLADQAMYAYPRGGEMVEGASIRLAEVMAQKYGNVHIEITIVNQTTERTEAVATAIDMQTNYIVSHSFIVPHQRTTKKGTKKLTDERDIREMVNNIGSRVLRECIFRILPPDFLEDAIAQCKKTQQSSDVPISEQIKKMVIAFDEQGVKVEHLEKRLGHKLDATIQTEIINLKRIYKSLRDGMATREDYFDMGNESIANKSVDDLIETKKSKPQPVEQDTETFLKEYDGQGNVVTGKEKAKEVLKDIKEKLNPTKENQ